MRVSRLLTLALFLTLGGCQCGPLGVDSTRFACATDADCLSGSSCRDLGQGLECVRNDVVIMDAGARPDAGLADAGGAGDAGVADAGGHDAGVDDAGLADAGDVDAGAMDAGAVDAGAVDAGPFDAGTVDAGNPVTFLTFTSAPQTVTTGTCTSQLVVESRNAINQPTPVSANTVVSIVSAPLGVTFFNNSNCAGGGSANGSSTIAAGNSTTVFYANSATASSYTLTASTAGIAPATQTLIVQAAGLPPNALAFVNTPPSPLRGGTCMPIALESRRGFTATPVTSAAPIGLTATPSTAANFFTDSTCTTSTTSTQIAAGNSTVSLFAKPLTGGSVTLTATASFATATQMLNVVPIVRRGLCNFAARTNLSDGGVINAMTSNCTLSPAVSDLGASMLLTQATGSIANSEEGSVEVRCRLTSTSNVACTRRQDANATSVHYQVAEVPTGMFVQRQSPGACPASVTLTTPVNPSKSFVLRTVANQTANFDDEDSLITELTSPTTVTVAPNTCDSYDLQVVQWEGIKVDRGYVNGAVDGGLAFDAGFADVTGLTPMGQNRAVLVQPHTTTNGARPLCSTMVRPTLPTPSQLSVARGAGDAGCPLTLLEQVHYERIDFGNKASVAEYTASFAAGQASRTVTVSQVDTTRTVVFSGDQAAGGQGVGETDFGGPAQASEALFQLVLTSSTTVTVTRADSTSAAVVTFYVAQLSP